MVARGESTLFVTPMSAQSTSVLSVTVLLLGSGSTVMTKLLSGMNTPGSKTSAVFTSGGAHAAVATIVTVAVTGGWGVAAARGGTVTSTPPGGTIGGGERLPRSQT